MNNDEVISILKNLIETCRDGQECFRNAAENCSNSELRRLFNIFAAQRAQFVAELRAELYIPGEDTDNVVNISGTRRRTWKNLKSTGPIDEASIISQCQSEEEAATSAYKEALRSDLPLNVHYVVNRHYNDIKDAYDLIYILRRAA